MQVLVLTSDAQETSLGKILDDLALALQAAYPSNISSYELLQS